MRSIIGREAQGLAQPLDLTDRKHPSAAVGAIKTLSRSTRYLEVMAKLDVGNGEHVDVATVIESVAAEFGAGDRLPLGLLVRCYLGCRTRFMCLTSEAESFGITRSASSSSISLSWAAGLHCTRPMWP